MFYPDTKDDPEWEQELTKMTKFHRDLLRPVFSKQEHAFKYADDSNSSKSGLIRLPSAEESHVFSFERKTFNGGRRYIVKTYEEMWEMYNSLSDEDKTFYEIIRENYPCNLYFDVEFSTNDNEGLNGEEVIELLIDLVLVHIQLFFEIITDRQDIIELDSSSDKKFSRHLIFKKIVFLDNSHCGEFVNDLASVIVHNKDSLGKLIVNKEKKDGTKSTENNNNNNMEVSDKTLVIDMGVYSRNRNFRLFKSTKLGKNRPLVISKSNTFQYEDEKDLFMCSIICNVGSIDLLKSLKKVLTYQSQYPKYSFKWIEHPPSMMMMLTSTGDTQTNMRNYTVKDMKKESYHHHDDTDSIDRSPSSSLNINIKRSPQSVKSYEPTSPSIDGNKVDSSTSPSKFKNRSVVDLMDDVSMTKLDRFMDKVVGQRPGKPGMIRNRVVFEGTIVYNVNGNKYCENISREHTSNHIMIVVDVKTRTYYQKCHDPDCRDFRSAPLPVPSNIFDSQSTHTTPTTPTTSATPTTSTTTQPEQDKAK
eukprot:TRINITY_DN1005_c1_g3_i2.p1 TRINITY_DN1005_c1_g3~~TRINITY_DN1005_c1_g3_i2.p1  ORF type:complete len:530 (-),score=143.53 TRINITY_DN1005_c1_g3_i2:21-1610(-)